MITDFDNETIVKFLYTFTNAMILQNIYGALHIKLASTFSLNPNKRVFTCRKCLKGHF